MKQYRIGWGIGTLALLLTLAAAALAQSERQIRITQVDVVEFPTVRLNLIVSDEALSPVTDLSTLAVSEAGQVVSPTVVTRVPVGVEMIFVIDADDSLLSVDAGSALSRRELVRDSISRYAVEFMNPAGRDRVSIIVPDDAQGALLLDGASSPTAVAEAIAAYEPAELPLTTPLAAMMELALAQAADAQAQGRFQAIVLFTNGGELGQQLDLAATAAQAQALSLPLYTAILGARADANEVANAAQLYEPTRAFYVHMPTPEGTDPIYTAVQAHATQAQVSYESALRQSGHYTVTAVLGDASASQTLALTIAPPQLQLITSNAQPLLRAGAAADTPLFQLQPAQLTLLAQALWPDGYTRAVSQVALLVDGVESLPLNAPAVDDGGQLAVVWDVAGLDAGIYAVALQITDAFGYTVQTEAVPFTITVSRPEPTVTPLPTPQPPAAGGSWLARAPWLARLFPWLLGGIGGSALLLLAALTLRRRRRAAAARDTLLNALDELQEPSAPVPVPEPAEDETAASRGPRLVILANGEPQTGPLRLAQTNITLGRDPELVDVVFTHRTVSRLHARIKQSEGRFWLYDEGSATGTYLNFVRIGLMPQPMQDRDEIHIGQVHLRFLL